MHLSIFLFHHPIYACFLKVLGILIGFLVFSYFWGFDLLANWFNFCIYENPPSPFLLRCQSYLLFSISISANDEPSQRSNDIQSRHGNNATQPLEEEMRTKRTFSMILKLYTWTSHVSSFPLSTYDLHGKNNQISFYQTKINGEPSIPILPFPSLVYFTVLAKKFQTNI